MRTLPIGLVAVLLGACAEVKPPPVDGAVDAVAMDSALVDSAVVDTLPETAPDAEVCAPPRYPPRTDGCPCQEIFTSHPCGPAIEGKVCDYLGKCPSIANRYVCMKVPASFQKPEHYEWVPNPGGVLPTCPGVDASTDVAPTDVGAIPG